MIDVDWGAKAMTADGIVAASATPVVNFIIDCVGFIELYKRAVSRVYLL